MNAGKDHKKALAQAQANANLTQTPRYISMWNGVYWVDKTPALHNCETVLPEQKDILTPDDNLQRTIRAEHCLKVYRKLTHDDAEDAACDLLADLMHWFDANPENVSFDGALESARHHHAEERQDSHEKD